MDKYFILGNRLGYLCDEFARTTRATVRPTRRFQVPLDATPAPTVSPGETQSGFLPYIQIQLGSREEISPEDPNKLGSREESRVGFPPGDTVGAVRYSRFVGSDRKHIVGFRPVYGFRRRTELFDAAVGLG